MAREVDGSTIVTAVVLTGGLVVGSGVGWLVYGGKAGALSGLVLGMVVALVGLIVMRALSSRGSFEDRPAPDVLNLPPEQAISVLGAMVDAGGAGGFQSAVLKQINEIRERAEGDLAGALEDAAALVAANPRSSAAAVEHAVLLKRSDREDEAREAGTKAIRMALDGGSNALAARTWEDLGELAPTLEFPGHVANRLAKALEVRGNDEGAAAVRAGPGGA